MINLKKTYTTSEGCEVRLFDIIDGDVFGAIKHSNGWYSRRWDVKTGKSVSGYSGYDLVEVKKKITHKCWVNVYGHTFNTFIDRKYADQRARHNRLACVEITVEAEEGEGL